MSMMTVPSLAPGARTLPGELRVPNGNAYGWHRLHQNLAPLTEPPSGVGDTIPVDPPVTISMRNFPNLPSQAAQAAVDAVAKVAQRFGSNAAVAVAAVLARFGPQVAPQAVASLQAFLTRQGVAGIGYYDASGVWQPDESPYPVVMDNGGFVSGDGSGSIDWGAIIASGSQSIANILAVSQGGSVTQTGTYGSAQTATAAAQAVPYGSLNVSGAGISGVLSSPVVLIGLGLVAFMVLKRK